MTIWVIYSFFKYAKEQNIILPDRRDFIIKNEYKDPRMGVYLVNAGI